METFKRSHMSELRYVFTVVFTVWHSVMLVVVPQQQNAITWKTDVAVLNARFDYIVLLQHSTSHLSLIGLKRVAEFGSYLGCVGPFLSSRFLTLALANFLFLTALQQYWKHFLFSGSWQWSNRRRKPHAWFK